MLFSIAQKAKLPIMHIPSIRSLTEGTNQLQHQHVLIRVDFNVPDRYLPSLRVGTPIQARPDPYPDRVQVDQLRSS